MQTEGKNGGGLGTRLRLTVPCPLVFLLADRLEGRWISVEKTLVAFGGPLAFKLTFCRSQHCEAAGTASDNSWVEGLSKRVAIPQSAYQLASSESAD